MNIYIYNTLLKKWYNRLYYIYSNKKCIIMKYIKCNMSYEITSYEIASYDITGNL